jgi:hypothetical protein
MATEELGHERLHVYQVAVQVLVAAESIASA